MFKPHNYTCQPPLTVNLISSDDTSLLLSSQAAPLSPCNNTTISTLSSDDSQDSVQLMIQELENLADEIKELRSTTSSSSSLFPVPSNMRTITSSSSSLLCVPPSYDRIPDLLSSNRTIFRHDYHGEESDMQGAYGYNKREQSAIYLSVPYILLTLPTMESITDRSLSLSYSKSELGKESSVNGGEWILIEKLADETRTRLRPESRSINIFSPPHAPPLPPSLPKSRFSSSTSSSSSSDSTSGTESETNPATVSSIKTTDIVFEDLEEIKALLVESYQHSHSSATHQNKNGRYSLKRGAGAGGKKKIKRTSARSGNGGGEGSEGGPREGKRKPIKSKSKKWNWRSLFFF
ncbi:hypothetical protein C8Q75DRAFT_805223 [Abortiporus biennis]|nr:hypothetical protein C8Q75DRAFT_805223 [Abortiporus biennis]